MTKSGCLLAHIQDCSVAVHALMENKLVENAYKDGFASKEYFKLTDKAKRKLLGELHLKSTGDGNNAGGIIKHRKIAAKELFFPSSAVRQVN